MDLNLLQKIIDIYSLTIVGFIMFFVIAIAQFYQKKFGIVTYYYFYFIPVFILLITIIHLYLYNSIISDILELVSALSSFLVSYFLYRLMVGVK